KEQVFAKIEKEWQSRLEEVRRTAVECNDCSSQTDQVTIVDEASSKELEGIVEDQRLQIQKSLKENMSSEEALKEFKIELENKYHRNLDRQVDAALTRAHAKWLQELTDLKEYKINLKAEREKWEKEHKETTAKQLALVLSTAEEKWKKEYENTEKSGPKVKELEEKVISLKKELELKKEEIPAAVKAELARVRAQWNKEKQEEILQLQEQNERDYRLFLDDHRNRIKEVLATAKEDLAKQRNELSIQKEAEIKMLLDQKQQEWEAHERKRLQDEINRYEEKTLVELEFLLSEIHEELVKCTHNKHSWKDKCFDTCVQLNSQCKDKLKACLQKAYRTTVYTILEKKEQEWKEVIFLKIQHLNSLLTAVLKKHKRGLSLLLASGKGKDGYRFDTCSLYRKESQIRSVTVFDANPKIGSLLLKAPWLILGFWGCFPTENGKVIEALIGENSEMKAKLKDLGTPPRYLKDLSKLGLVRQKLLFFWSVTYVYFRPLLKGGISKPCMSCDAVKGLEEMRAQYIKAVNKIKCDMLCYIRESKERAAEMIKAEVLRERQETARKMRKYYLTCLQQLLTDNGKQEGAEKKIMNAASKLATMAKGLETPL
ncbi:CE152 protein, partial [Psilopogon haemacephalus]|nr:CE152 protein [Psilopogon haemacephalus]